MKIGVNTLFLVHFEFEEGLRFVQERGTQMIEISVVGEASRKYCDPDKLLADRGELDRWLDTLKRYGLEISALAAHGDALSPNKDVAEGFSRQFRQACELAEAAGVDRLTLNSGLPAGAPDDTSPCWVVDPSKPHNRSILRWQWEERVIPVWRQYAKIAQDHGCLLCIEPWIGDVVHSPTKLMRLRDEIGPVIGCNLDPSHLFVQQIDVLETILYLSEAIYHVHIKDTRFNTQRLKLQGLLDTTPLLNPQERPWNFTLIGWGHDHRFWSDFITNLRFVGYEGALSVEMESDYMNVTEGLEKSFAYVRSLALEEAPAPDTHWWEYAGFHGIMED